MALRGMLLLLLFSPGLSGREDPIPEETNGVFQAPTELLYTVNIMKQSYKVVRWRQYCCYCCTAPVTKGKTTRSTRPPARPWNREHLAEVPVSHSTHKKRYKCLNSSIDNAAETHRSPTNGACKTKVLPNPLP